MEILKIKKIQQNPMYRYLMVLTISSAIGLQAWRTLFDNFAVRIVGLNGDHVGIIQSVREIPGFLALLAVFVIMLIKEHRLSALSVLILGIGVAATGLFPSFGGLLATTLIMSFGFHYFETTNQSLTLQYFDKNTSPWVFGKLRGLSAASNIGIGIFIYLVASFLNFTQLYLLIGGLIAEYQNKFKLKFSAFLRQHSSCVPLSGILKKVVINQFQPSQFDVFDVQHNRW
jgi:hypothetical protein